jgi:hypothetical protein
MSKLHIEDWTLPDGRSVPFRVATKSKTLVVTEQAIKYGKALDPYGCARAIVLGEQTDLPTIKERMEWGQAVFRGHAILAEKDSNSPVGRTRVLYLINGKVAKKVDNGEKVEPQTEELRAVPADKTPQVIREAQRERNAKIKSGEIVVDHRRKRSRAATKAAAERGPSRPRLQRIAPVA